MKLPWKNDHPLLQYNFMLAQCWLDHKLAKILKWLQLLVKYDCIMKEHLERGINGSHQNFLPFLP